MLKIDGLFLFDQLRSKNVDFSFRRVDVEDASSALKEAFPNAGVVLEDHGPSRKIRNFVDDGFVSVGRNGGFEQVVHLKANHWFFFAIPSNDYASKVLYRISSR